MQRHSLHRGLHESGCEVEKHESTEHPKKTRTIVLINNNMVYFFLYTSHQAIF